MLRQGEKAGERYGMTFMPGNRQCCMIATAKEKWAWFAADPRQTGMYNCPLLKAGRPLLAPAMYAGLSGEAAFQRAIKEEKR